MKNRCRFLESILWLWVTYITSYLTYKMTTSDGVTFASDYLVHIKYSLAGKGYSLLSLIIILLYRISNSTLPIAVLIGVIVSTTGVAIRKVLLYSIDVRVDKEVVNKNYNIITFLSFALLFISSLYIPEKTPFYLLTDEIGNLVRLEHTYIQSYLTQPWHNSTYIAMRLFAMISIVVYIRIIRNVDIKIIDFIAFFVSLVLSNMFKPNFIVAFAPSVFIFFIVAMIQKKDIKKYIILLAIIVLSMCPLIYQYKVLYTADNDSGIVLTFSVIKELINGGYFKWMVLATYLFPTLVSILCIHEGLFDYIFGFAWVFEVVTFIQKHFLLENGMRMLDGNWGWNMMFASLVLYVVCIGKLLSLREMEDKQNNFYNLTWGILAIHIIYGFMYFGMILRGGAYAI
ncbi:hypothetical protein SAMN02910384_02342 [Pseudobutyrivibrio sp. ACV-2]|uniref:hypothetical protein n=1 Tax=Pseudobutyrivibrio sp. ACV-2 TaxID=1520801 RepID=UPI000894750C|nr:hypothetical protein [Pseudobutyrivibrio sp. ACV-2]SEA78344.1 hypothetical protein SAMN02910384_02342 [Pseudobutyrivibrio sp. ACV-2]